MPFEFIPIDTFQGVYVIKPKVFSDPRGFFMELFKAPDFHNHLSEITFVQDNLSFSRKHVLRGLHFQKPPYTQAKLVTVLQGEALDVIVDLRKSQPTYGKHFQIHLKAEEPILLFVPEGFAHGFVVLSDTCLFYYKCSRIYHAPSDGGIRWNSPELGIDWEVSNPLVSEKDNALPLFSEFQSPFN